MKKQLLPFLLFLIIPFFLFSKNSKSENFASFAGTMDLTPVSVCGGGTVMPAHNNDETLDPGDVLAFVLHDQQGPFLGNVLALEFGANPTFEMTSNMSFNTTYYLSAIAGEDLGGGTINIADPELSVAMGTPVVFSQASSVQLNEAICFGDTYTAGGQTFTTSGNYNITLTTAQGCDSIIDLTLTVIDVSATALAVEPITCFNPVAILEGWTNYTGPGQVTYSWTTNGLQQPIFGQSIEVFFGGPYTLTVTVTLNNITCSSTSQTFVEEITFIPWFEIAGNTSVCGGGSTTLQLIHNNSCPIIQWSGLNGFSSNAEVVTITESGTYTVSMMDCFSGCEEFQSITVEIFNELEIGDNLFLDCGTTTAVIEPEIINTAAGVTYQWTTTDGNIVSGDNSPNPTVDASGTYVVEVNDNNTGCIATDEVEVVAFDASADAGEDMVLTCVNASATIGGNNTNTNPNNSFEWVDNNGNVISTAPITTVNDAGVYVLVVTDIISGCTAMDEVLVMADYDVPTVIINVSNMLDCNNITATLDGNGSSTGFNVVYEWIDMNGSSIGTNPTITVSNAGNYSLIVTNVDNGCSNQDMIIVDDNTSLPTIDFSNGTELNCFNGYTTTLAPDIFGTSNPSFFWQGPNGFTSTNSTLTITGQNAAGNYLLEVVDNNNGCSGAAEVIVTVEDANFDIVTTSADCDMTNGTASITNIPSNYTYTWSNFETTQTITDLAQGWYSVTVSDPSSTCHSHENFYVDEDISCKVVIGGYVVKDLNQSCTYDPSMEGVDAVMVKLEPLGIFTYTNADGYYEFVVDNGNYTVEYITNTSVDLICPLPSTYDVSLNTNGTSSLNNHFFVEGKIYDLCLSKNIGAARPNRKQFNCVMACNYSEESQNAVVTFTHDPMFAEVTPLPNIFPINSVAYNYTYDPATYTFTWQLNNLQPDQCVKIMFRMKVPITANIGDVISTTAKVGPLAGDVNPQNNCLAWNRPITNSFDPNDKRNMIGETPWGGGIEMDDETMEYAIRFQNVGNDTAFAVVIRDTIDTDHLDVTTIRDVVASHEYQLEFEGHNVLIFRFDDIMLVDSFTNEPESNGWVSYNIDRKPGLNFGTEIRNQAAIYFDYNAPIITNEVVNTIESHFFDVEGFIHTYNDKEVENVNVAVTGDVTLNTTSDANGTILLEDVLAGSELNFDFEKDINLLNGVTTFDIVLIHRHIIGTEILDSPYKIIAADANRSNHVTTHDIVVIKSAILHLTDEFPNNESWRFVDGDFSFTDPTDPFLDDFPETISIPNLENDRVLDVVGIKVGDINGSASPDLFTHVDDRGLEENVSLVVDNEVVRVGEEVLVPFSSNDFTSLQAFQFTLAFAKEKLKFEGFEKGVLENMTANDFYFSPSENGKVMFAYASPEVQTFRIGEPLFYLKFKILENTNLKEVLNIINNPTDAIAYDKNGNDYNIALTFDDKVQKTDLHIYPNPTNNHLFVDFSIEKESEVTLEIYNSYGQLERVIFQNKKYNKGISKHQIDVDGLSSGTYLIYLKTKEENFIQRFVKM